MSEELLEKIRDKVESSKSNEVSESKSFLKGLERRQQTLLVVSEFIVEAQRNFLNGKTGKRAVSNKEIAEKLQSYLSIKVKSFLILELAAVLGVIGLYLTKNQLFTGLYLAVMFVFSLTRPTFEKIAGDIRVSQKALTEWGKDQP